MYIEGCVCAVETLKDPQGLSIHMLNGPTQQENATKEWCV